MAIEDVGSVVENDPDRVALEEKSDETISEEVTEEVEESDSDRSEGEDSGEGDGGDDETSEEVEAFRIIPIDRVRNSIDS